MSGKWAKRANEINGIFWPDMAGHKGRAPNVRGLGHGWTRRTRPDGHDVRGYPKKIFFMPLSLRGVSCVRRLH